MKRTEIICTIGPASWTNEELTEMANAGMTIARLNGAFIDIPQMQMVQDKLKLLCPSVKLLLDIKGVEVRIDIKNDEYKLKISDTFTISHLPEFLINQQNPVLINYDISKDIKVGNIIKIDKGATISKVLTVNDNLISCEIIQGGIIKPGKGMNLPGTYLNHPAVSKKDLEQIQFAIANKWEYLAASFVRDISDVNLIKKHSGNLKVIAKIEDQFGLNNIKDISNNVYGIMIARGDLGAEIGDENVPTAARMIINTCKNDLIIYATELLESMISNDKPKAAEVADIYWGIEQGVTGLMLSGESSVGKDPSKCIKIFREIESVVNNIHALSI